MARPLSIAELATVPVGGSFCTDKPGPEVKRKAKEYGARCNPPKRFAVTLAGPTAPDPFGPNAVRVTRLPDPPKGSHGYPPCDVNPQP